MITADVLKINGYMQTFRSKYNDVTSLSFTIGDIEAHVDARCKDDNGVILATLRFAEPYLSLENLTYDDFEKALLIVINQEKIWRFYVLHNTK